MDMPARPDGPPVKNRKPYSAIAHLAEDNRAVDFPDFTNGAWRARKNTFARTDAF